MRLSLSLSTDTTHIQLLVSDNLERQTGVLDVLMVQTYVVSMKATIVPLHSKEEVYMLALCDEQFPHMQWSPGKETTFVRLSFADTLERRSKSSHISTLEECTRHSSFDDSLDPGVDFNVPLSSSMVWRPAL